MYSGEASDDANNDIVRQLTGNRPCNRSPTCHSLAANFLISINSISSSNGVSDEAMGPGCSNRFSAVAPFQRHSSGSRLRGETIFLFPNTQYTYPATICLCDLPSDVCSQHFCRFSGWLGSSLSSSRRPGCGCAGRSVEQETCGPTKQSEPTSQPAAAARRQMIRGACDARGGRDEEAVTRSRARQAGPPGPLHRYLESSTCPTSTQGAGRFLIVASHYEAVHAAAARPRLRGGIMHTHTHKHGAYLQLLI